MTVAGFPSSCFYARFWSVTSKKKTKKKGDGSGKSLKGKSNMQKKTKQVLRWQEVVFNLETHLPDEI